MPDATVAGIDLWWIVTVGTAITLALALGFVLIVFYHERSTRKLERESEQRYSELFQNVNDLVYVHSADGIIQEVNRSVTSLLALPREAMIGRSIGDFLPRASQPLFRQYLARATEASAGGEVTGLLPLTREASAHGPGRDLILLEYRSRVILDASGNVVSVWGIARDQTERIRQERAIGKSARQIERLYRESEKMREELSVLSQKMMQLQEEDRLRISRELHDEVGQTLTAISTTLEIVKRDLPLEHALLQSRLVEAQTLARDVTQCVRRVVRELRPVAIDELGLIPSLKKYVSEFEARSGIHTVFNYDPLEEELSLNEKITIYRIVQESLTNIARHSGASEALVSLLEREDTDERGEVIECITSLEISDNGHGIDRSGVIQNGRVAEASMAYGGSPASGESAHPAPGVGLLGIHERVKLLSGTFHIGSGALGGTRLSITLPRKVA